MPALSGIPAANPAILQRIDAPVVSKTLPIITSSIALGSIYVLSRILVYNGWTKPSSYKPESPPEEEGVYGVLTTSQI
jgi:hypothetical protein